MLIAGSIVLVVLVHQVENRCETSQLSRSLESVAQAARPPSFPFLSIRCRPHARSVILPLLLSWLVPVPLASISLFFFALQLSYLMDRAHLRAETLLVLQRQTAEKSQVSGSVQEKNIDQLLLRRKAKQVRANLLAAIERLHHHQVGNLLVFV